MTKQQDYHCRECQSIWTDEWVDGDDLESMRHLISCPFCYSLDTVYKKFSVSTPRPMQEHFNPATGTVESSMKAIKEKFKVASEEATIRTGVLHNFQPVDLRDTKTLGVTEEGLDATRRRKREMGLTEGKTFHQMPNPKVTWEQGHVHD